MKLQSSLLLSLALGAACLFFSANAQTGSPKPYPPLPSQGQLQWHDMEMYAFTHFTTNTFTDKEWGFGDEDPNLFAPTDYDPDQIVGTLAKAGFKGVVVTCKHHDGFCLWPTKTTRHSVASTKWQNGKGDVVRDFSKACGKFGIKFGIYVSPWDRNHPDYGTKKYIDVYREQLKELLTNYGPVFIVWHDGANGGDGYYGGKRDKRSIDRSTYYDWPATWSLVRKLQPNAVIFSDVGPDVRWVGNEHGTAGYPCWATYTPRTSNGTPPAPGHTVGKDGEHGTLNGKFWMPAEVDVSIRPGWFWHASQNNRVRTPDNLLNLYFNSVGRGANLNLNVPPDRRGKIHENDVAALQGFHDLLTRLYSRNFAEGATATATSTLDGTSPANIFKQGRNTYWMASAQRDTTEIAIKLPGERTFSIVRLGEPIQLGQRIRKFSVQIKDKDNWVPWVEGSSIGPRVLLRGKPVTASELLVTITQSDAAPALSEFSLWMEPVSLQAPKFSLATDGIVTIDTHPALVTRYTLDGNVPDDSSPVYDKPLSLPKGGMLKVRHFSGKDSSPVVSIDIPVATSKWKVLQAEKSAAVPERAFDGNTATLWHTHGKSEIPPPLPFDVDMGEEINIDSILYTPRQDGNLNGVVSKYEVYISNSPDNWGEAVAAGEFSNIQANPIRQRIQLNTPINGRYLRFVAKEVLKASHVSMAELGVIAAE